MNKTQIEWVKNPDGTQGYTWNPITGCLNHDNGICKGGGFPCYAYKIANGRVKNLYLANKNITRTPYETRRFGLNYMAHEADPFYPRFWPEKLKRRNQGFGDLSSGAIPKGIFVCDMSDLFGIGVPEQWTKRILENIGQPWYREHRFYLLTKQPQNLARWSPFPDNCWVGVTITNRYQAHNASHYFPYIEAKVKYISFEPLLDDVCQALYCWNDIVHADWIIIGAQTKLYKPPKIEWVIEIAEAADNVGIPVFLKNNLMPLMKPVYDQAGAIDNLFTGGDGTTPVLRQEMPTLSCRND